MKKLLTYLTIALSLIMGFGTNVEAKTSTPQLIISMTKDGYIPNFEYIFDTI